MRTFLWALLLAGGPVAAAAQPVVVRLGTHAGFGRVVFEFPQPVDFTTERAGESVILHFQGGGDVPSSAGGTRNITAVTGGSGTATLAVVPGARLHTMRLGNRVVVDVQDAVAMKRTLVQPAAAPARAKPARPIAPQAALAPPATPAPAPSPAPPSAPPAASVAVPAAATEAVSVQPAQATPAATLLPEQSPPALHAEPPPAPPLANPPAGNLAIAAIPSAPRDGKGSAVVLPFGPSAAAAAFRHGDEAWIVFDERRPIDVSALSDDPVFAGAVVQMLPSATLLRLKLPSSRDVRLERRPEGWQVIAPDIAGQGLVTMPVTRPARLLVPVASPGQVVTVPDPDTGRNLLVGTLRVGGPGVPVPVRVPEFAIRPSWQGIVVEPVSDRTSVRSVQEGFAIETGGALSPAPDNAKALASASVLTRRFDFPDEPVAALLRRLQAQTQEIGEAPPQARVTLRKRAAQTMLALGLDAEAQSLLGLAVSEDPRAVADPEINGLSAIAALLCGRPLEADGLDAPGLSGTDEVALWRAVRSAMNKEGSGEAAQVFATTAGLLLSYPSALRNRLLPLAAETMALGGSYQAADALLASLPDEPLLTFARAIRLEQKGETAPALAAYDALANGRDRLSAARAATRATMLRLKSGAFTPAEAATALERSFIDWRGDARERDLRLSAADIEAQAGQWRKAIETLKETAVLFPADSASIAARVTAVLSGLLHGPGASKIAPLDLVSLADENAAAVAQTDVAGMALLLADKLTALDLPARAGPVIERMAAAAPVGEGRATLGARLAALRLGEGDAAGAASALTTTDAPGLPLPLQETRGLIDARIHARQHDTAGATAILSSIGTPVADELRATILGADGDWHGAALALEAVVARTLPASGPLEPAQQDLVLRLASAHSSASDDAALRTLGVKQAGRMSGARGDMFRLLTTAPVTGVGDLHRAAGDIALARALPSSLSAIGSR